MLHHDNVPVHSSLFYATVFGAKLNGGAFLSTLSYLSHLASCDFGLFLRMKIKLKCRCFDTLEEIQAESQAALNKYLYRSKLPENIPIVENTLGLVY